MDTDRVPIRSTMQIYERELVSNFVLGCIQQTVYVLMKKGTIYIYDSKRSCLNNPQKPMLFFNLVNTKISREGKDLVMEDNNTKLRLWSADESDLSMLEESASTNRRNLDVQRIFNKKFEEMDVRISEKRRFENLED